MTSIKRRIAMTAALALWAGAAVGGMGMVMAALTRPDAPAAAVAAHWPDGLPFARAAGRPTLVVCLHPKCPCSAATLDAVRRLMPRYGDGLDAHVLFALPEGGRPDWTDTDLVRQARAVPRLDVRPDPGGRGCALLGARTSGQTFFYDGDGRLLLCGGLTPARGEGGPTPAADRIAAVLAGGDSPPNGAPPPGVLTTPVFGCALCRPAATLSDHATTAALAEVPR